MLFAYFTLRTALLCALVLLSVLARRVAQYKDFTAVTIDYGLSSGDEAFFSIEEEEITEAEDDTSSSDGSHSNDEFSSMEESDTWPLMSGMTYTSDRFPLDPVRQMDKYFGVACFWLDHLSEEQPSVIVLRAIGRHLDYFADKLEESSPIMNNKATLLQIFEAYLEDRRGDVNIPFKSSWIELGGSQLVELFFAQQTDSYCLPDSFWMALRTLNRSFIIDLLASIPTNVLQKMNRDHIQQIDPVFREILLEAAQINNDSH